MSIQTASTTRATERVGKVTSVVAVDGANQKPKQTCWSVVDV